MPKQERKAPKGLPKRVGNVRAKERRARSWARGQERKEARRVAAAKRHHANELSRGLSSARNVRRETRRAAAAARGPVPTAPRVVTRKSAVRVPAVGAALIRHARTMMDNGHDLPFHYRYSNLPKVA